MANFKGHSAEAYMVNTPGIKQSNLEEMVKRYNYFIFDCDGVLFHSQDEIGQAFKALDYIKSFPGKDIFFFTNATTRTRMNLVKKVQNDHGFYNIGEENIYTASYCASIYLKEDLLPKKLEAEP